MKVLVWDSESESLENFLELAQKYVDIDLFEDLQDLVDEVAPDDLVALDLDADHKEVEKAVKKIKKSKTPFQLIYLCNNLSSKELAKHQKSKLGADVYLRCPVDEKLLANLLGPLVGEDFKSDYLERQRAILFEHEAKDSLNQEAVQANEKLDGIFKEALGEVSEAMSVLEKLALEEEKENAAPPEEFSLEESDDEGGMEDEPKLPNEDNLTYPDLDLSDLNNTDDEDKQEQEKETEHKEPDMAANDKKLDLDENSLEELDLSGDEQKLDELDLSEEDAGSLDLSGDDDGAPLDLSDDGAGSLDLSDDGAGSLDLSDDEAGSLDLSDDEAGSLDLSDDEAGSLDLSDDDAGSLDLSGGDNVAELDLAQDDGTSLDLSEDDGSDEMGELSFGSTDEDSSVEEPSLEESSLEELSSEDEGFSDEDLFGAGAESSEELSADSLPDSIDFDGEKPTSTTGMSESALEKLAEIEEMMKADQVSAAPEKVMESTGEINLQALNEEALEEDLEETPFDLAGQIDSDEPDYDPTREDSESLAALNMGHKAAKPESDFEDYLDENSVSASSRKTLNEQREVLAGHDDQFMRLAETIKHLREDRESLLEKISVLERRAEEEKGDLASLRAELDEKKIELSLSSKRRAKQVEELKYQLEISDEKKMILEERNRRLETENEKLRKKATIDLSRIKGRERELENKLELLKADSDLQIKNRDLKILELKRKIDTLEFDIESIQMKEKKTVDSNFEKEERMERVINTLRRAIGELEEDDIPLRNLDKIKNNLDV